MLKSLLLDDFSLYAWIGSMIKEKQNALGEAGFNLYSCEPSSKLRVVISKQL